MHVLALGIATLACLAAVFGFLSLKSKKHKGPIQPGTILVLDLSDPLAESPRGLKPFHPHTTTVLAATQALKHGAEDNRIAGLLIRGDGPFPSTQGEVLKYELSQAIQRFKKKKPVIAYLRDSSRQDYVLATSAHKVYMHPLSTLSLLGVGYEGIYFGEAFETYGLKAHVFKCGRYKSATEPFTQSQMSAESREQLSALAEELWQDNLATIAQGRFLTNIQASSQVPYPTPVTSLPQVKSSTPVQASSQGQSLDAAALNAIAQAEGLFSPARALELGLIDGILQEDAVYSQFENAVFEASTQSYHKLPLRDYAEHLETQKPDTPTIAILYAEGVIAKNTKNWDSLNVPALVKDLQRLRADGSIQGIVVRINSPGGEASLSEDLRHAIALTAAQKPLVVSMGSYAASGGYWASLGASTVFANPSTLTGSIGVFGMLIDWSSLGQKHGIKGDRVGTSPLSSLYSTSHGKTQAELQALQRMTDYTYELFLEHVAKARKLSLDAVQAVAEGRIFSGKKALELGLVDHLGTLEEALHYLTPGLDYFNIEEYPKAKSYAELWEDIWAGGPYILSQALSCLPKSLQQILFYSSFSHQPSVLTLLDTTLSPL